MKARTHIALAALAALPSTAGAEGARLVLDCTDAAGIAARFTLAPEALDETGAGLVSIAWPDGLAHGVAASSQGPWAWTDGPTQYSLAIDAIGAGGGPELILHRFTPGAGPAVTAPYTCEAPT